MNLAAALPTAQFPVPWRWRGQRPSWKALALLTLSVLAVHAWLLATAPSRISPAMGPVMPPALEMRRVEAAPPPAPAVVTPGPVAAAPAPQPVRKPISKPKRPTAQVNRAQAAPELIAQPEPPPAASAPPDSAATPADPVSDAANAAADALAAAAAAVAAANKPAAEAPATPASAAVPALPETTAVNGMVLPGSTELNYEATGEYRGVPNSGTGKIAWHHDGGSYNLRATLSTFFKEVSAWSSVGQLTPEGLAPTRFAEKKIGSSEVAAHFAAEKAQVTFSANTAAMPWIKGTQDRATIVVQLAGMLAANPAAFPPGSSISLYTVGPRSASVWTFNVDAEETISVPAGNLKVVKLTQKPRGEYDRKIELWLAPFLGYLPARIKYTEFNGDWIEQRLSEVKTF
jgi:Protein of unknown function (DUF3108)